VKSREEAMTEATTMMVLDQLGESLIFSSAALARVRRASKACKEAEREIVAVDEAFSRSITLARTLRERLLAAFEGEYASLANAARDVVRCIQGASEGARISLECEGAPIITGTTTQLRYIIGCVLNRALSADAEVSIAVREIIGARRVGEIVVRYAGDVDVERRELALEVQPAVNAVGGVMRVTVDGACVVVVIQAHAAGGEAT
jgi:hypothetical protein